MKKQVLTLLSSVVILLTIPTLAKTSNTSQLLMDEIESTRLQKTAVFHDFTYSDKNCMLRAPLTREEWQSYHEIRKAEIHDRYCPNETYNPNEEEELIITNFRFVLIDTSLSNSQVIGAIRVDLLENEEASYRWVAIEKNHQRGGFGKVMMRLAEMFVVSQNRKCIRIPAANDSKEFYEKLGYQMSPWPNGPNCADTIPLAKKLTTSTEKRDGV